MQNDGPPKQENVHAIEQNLNKVQLDVAEEIRKAIDITKEDSESLEQISEVVIRQYEGSQFANSIS